MHQYIQVFKALAITEKTVPLSFKKEMRAQSILFNVLSFWGELIFLSCMVQKCFRVQLQISGVSQRNAGVLVSLNSLLLVLSNKHS